MFIYKKQLSCSATRGKLSDKELTSLTFSISLCSVLRLGLFVFQHCPIDMRVARKTKLSIYVVIYDQLTIGIMEPSLLEETPVIPMEKTFANFLNLFAINGSDHSPSLQPPNRICSSPNTVIGFGTTASPQPEQLLLKQTVLDAIKLGYLHFDTSPRYLDEALSETISYLKLT
ncbi:hypothetical protein YC2023_099377 [Brassica napus]